MYLNGSVICPNGLRRTSPSSDSTKMPMTSTWPSYPDPMPSTGPASLVFQVALVMQRPLLLLGPLVRPTLSKWFKYLKFGRNSERFIFIFRVISRNQKSIILCAGIQYGTEANWEYAFQRFLNPQDPNERGVILNALTCTETLGLQTR